MPLLPYSLARPFLFSMDAEAVHDLTISMLSKPSMRWTYASEMVSDPITLAGLQFPNRIGMGAGLDKNARCIDALGAMGFGFVEVGTVTPKAQPGNPKPRIFRLPEASAIINRLGFNNEGLDAFVRNVKKSRIREQTPVGSPRMLLGINIGKNATTAIENAADDYLTCMDAVFPHADYITLNVSSPNTANLRSLQTDEALDSLLSAVASRRSKLAQDFASNGSQKHVPLFLKIAPDLDEAQVKIIAAALKRHGMDGVIATNTTLARDAVAHLQHGTEAGGLSGAPVFSHSNKIISQMRAEVGSHYPIIGIGGVINVADAKAKIAAGADLVQIYTGLIYNGPEFVPAVAKALKAVPRTT